MKNTTHSKNNVIGIDGGLNGAIAVLHNDDTLTLYNMPIVPTGNGRNEYDCAAIIDILEQYPDAHVAFEKAQATPTLGVTSAFSFGKSYGEMLGILVALKRSYTIVFSRTWQKKMFQDMPKADTKATSKLIAQRLFPTADFTSGPRSKKLHDGKTDAALIAYYAKHTLL